MIYPFEIAAALAVAAMVVFLRAHGLRIDWSTVRYTVPPMLTPTLFALVAGIPLQLLYRLCTRRSIGAYLRQAARWDWLQLWGRLWIAYMATTYAYFWLKVCVPLVHQRLYDPELWRLDRALHLGVSPSLFATAVLHGTPWLGWLDGWYALWLPTLFYSVAFFLASDDALFRRRMMLASVLTWTLGAWLYTALPAVGPCYNAPDVFAATREETPRAAVAQEVLLDNYRRVVAGRQSGELQSFNPTRGVAALPSLHVGLHFLLLLFAWRQAPPLRVPFLVAVLLTFLGSVATGWHYAVDGYVGVLLALLSWRVACAVERPPREAESSRPAEAAAPSAGRESPAGTA